MLVIHNKIRLVTIPKYWFLIPSLTTLDKMPYHFVVNARIRIGANFSLDYNKKEFPNAIFESDETCLFPFLSQKESAVKLIKIDCVRF